MQYAEAYKNAQSHRLSRCQGLVKMNLTCILHDACMYQQAFNTFVLCTNEYYCEYQMLSDLDDSYSSDTEETHNQMAIECLNGNCADINKIILAKARAIKALQKQIPQEVKVIDSGITRSERQIFSMTYVQCPACRNRVTYFGKIPDYCSRCGQKVKETSKNTKNQ